MKLTLKRGQLGEGLKAPSTTAKVTEAIAITAAVADSDADSATLQCIAVTMLVLGLHFPRTCVIIVAIAVVVIVGGGAAAITAAAAAAATVMRVAVRLCAYSRLLLLLLVLLLIIVVAVLSVLGLLGAVAAVLLLHLTVAASAGRLVASPALTIACRQRLLSSGSSLSRFTCGMFALL